MKRYLTCLTCLCKLFSKVVVKLAVMKVENSCDRYAFLRLILKLAWSYTHKGIARIEQAGEITVIAIYAAARMYILCSLSDVASAESPKSLLQALQIRISDRQRNVLLTHLTYFWTKRYFQRSSFSGPRCRLSYPNAVLCSCANEMNVQKRETPEANSIPRKRGEKKYACIARNIWRRFHRLALFFSLKTSNFHS